MSFGQRIRNFLWDNKTSLIFGSLSAVLVVYMMKQRSEHIKVLEEYMELKAEHNTLLNAVKECDVKGSQCVDIINSLRSQLQELEVMLGKLISLTTK